jgi:hypothetical protein
MNFIILAIIHLHAKLTASPNRQRLRKRQMMNRFRTYWAQRKQTDPRT